MRASPRDKHWDTRPAERALAQKAPTAGLTRAVTEGGEGRLSWGLMPASRQGGVLERSRMSGGQSRGQKPTEGRGREPSPGDNKGSTHKDPPALQETLLQLLGREDPLEKAQAAHSNILGLPWWQKTRCGEGCVSSTFYDGKLET